MGIIKFLKREIEVENEKCCNTKGMSIEKIYDDYNDYDEGCWVILDGDYISVEIIYCPLCGKKLETE